MFPFRRCAGLGPRTILCIEQQLIYVTVHAFVFDGYFMVRTYIKILCDRTKYYTNKRVVFKACSTTYDSFFNTFPVRFGPETAPCATS